MSQTRHDPPVALLEMFERREGDVRPALPMPPSIRRRVRVRRGAIAGAAVAAFALTVAIAVGTLPLLNRSEPATPQPPVPTLAPTVSGRTEIYRWRVLAGQGEGGRIETELQTSSLAGGPWVTVADRSFDPGQPSFSASYLAAGQFLDRPSTTVVWGLLPAGSERVVFEPGEGCEPITIDAADAVAPPGETVGLWATDVRCSGPGTIVAEGSDGTAIATTGYLQPIPADVWALTTSRHGGIGWVLRRILDPPSGIGIGDAGNPNDIGSPIRGDQLNRTAPVVWDMTPPTDDGTFVFGISVREVDHVVLVLPGGETVEATFTVLPGDAFDVFWADVSGATPQQLVAYNAACKVIANDSVDGSSVGDPPAGACTPNG